MLSHRNFTVACVILFVVSCETKVDTDPEPALQEPEVKVETTSERLARMKNFEQQLRNADTVMAVSHIGTGSPYKDSVTNKYKNPPELLIDGRLNTEIIKESKILARADLDTLIAALARPAIDSSDKWRACLDPHHAILVINKQKIAYLDICFGCLGIRESGIDGIQRIDFDTQKWIDMESLLVKWGFTYEL